jgi:hypothetical protein
VRGETCPLGLRDLGADLVERAGERLHEVAHRLLALRELGGTDLLAAPQPLLRLDEELLRARGEHLARERLELRLELAVVALDLGDPARGRVPELGELLLVRRAREVEPLVGAALRGVELPDEPGALGVEPLRETRAARGVLLRLPQERGETADLGRGGVRRRTAHREDEHDAADETQHEADGEEQPSRNVHARTFPRGTDRTAQARPVRR